MTSNATDAHETARISLSIEAGVADLRLTRASKMNALDAVMFDALIETGEKLKRDNTVRAVVISGEGRAFCAGLDMSNFGQMTSGERERGQSSAGGRLDKRSFGIANRVQQAVLVWRQVPVPVIAAVHGVAFGGGFQLSLGADMRYMAPDTRLSVMEVKWGLVPDMGGMLLMPALARGDIIRELTFTAREFSGVEAKDYGFATRICADPREEALSTAREIASKSPHAVRAAKRLLNLAIGIDAAAILRAESAEQMALIASPNQIEAVKANLQKRAPDFAVVPD